MNRTHEEGGQSLRHPSLRRALEVLWQDLHYNVRVLCRAGPLSVAVALTLVVGLGLNSVVFSIFNGLLFRPSATRNPDTFVQVYAQLSGAHQRAGSRPVSVWPVDCAAFFTASVATLMAAVRAARNEPWSALTTT